MSDYDFRPGGSLKLKTGIIEGGVTKKKKKAKSKLKVRDAEEAKTSSGGDDNTGEGSSSKLDSKSANGVDDNKTEAERRFEEVKRQRMAKKAIKMASRKHKDLVSEFNARLEALSEHHDIPKVGPG
ncbi:hypothetical protein M0805_003543 [Coniferiporia weirii]|nr:hypothetical protein M0805_003543 [Coniferiporia weirii]